MDREGEECILNDGAADHRTVGPQSVTEVLKADFDAKYNIVDIHTPLNNFLSAQYKRSYAYYSLLNILPVVLTKVIDSLTKDKSELVEQFGEVCINLWPLFPNPNIQRPQHLCRTCVTN